MRRTTMARLVLAAAACLLPPAAAFAPRFAFSSSGRKLFGGYRIVPAPCKAEGAGEGRQGVCMFNYECAQRQGEVVGACMDGFLFGACCRLPAGAQLPPEAANLPVRPAFETPSTVEADVYQLVTGSTTTQRPQTSPVTHHTERVPPSSFVATRPTPPTFGPASPTPRPQATSIPDEDVHNSAASISHILHLLNDSSMAESIPEAGLVLISSSQAQNDAPTLRPQPSLSTWVSVNKAPGGVSTTTQRVPSNQASFIVTSNNIRPVTPRPTPSVPAPTVIVLGPFATQDQQLTPPVVSRPSGDAVAVEAQPDPLEEEFVAPTFEEADLTNKVHTFVDKIVNSLAGDFQNLEDVVLSNRNITLNAATSPAPPTTTTKRPTKRPTTANKPNKKPTSSTPSVQAVEAETPKPTRKPTTNKPPWPASATSTTTTTITTTNRPGDARKTCGVRPLMKKNGRIVGGKGATFGAWPWQVLVRESTWLGLFTKNKCGGVLVSSKFVITAAHCQPGFLASLVAVFGEYDLSGDLESRKAIVKNVKRVIIHRNYLPATFENDIALLELESPVQFDEHIMPICLPDDSDNFVGRMATVSGWGRLKYGGGVPSVLQEVQVPIMENGVCQDMFHTSGHQKEIIPSFLCAGYANGQKDSCEGDSGGPLMIERDGRWILAGTVSHGIKCAAPFLPGVYMRTTYYKPWLKTITGIS